MDWCAGTRWDLDPFLAPVTFGETSALEIQLYRIEVYLNGIVITVGTGQNRIVSWSIGTRPEASAAM